MPTEELKPYFQKRFVCAQHGYFDVMTESKLKDDFRPKCPVCKHRADPREGYECTGKTLTPLPHITKPRIEESIVHEFPEFSQKGFRQARRNRS